MQFVELFQSLQKKFSNSDVDSPTEGENDTPAADTAPPGWPGVRRGNCGCSPRTLLNQHALPNGKTSHAKISPCCPVMVMSLYS